MTDIVERLKAVAVTQESATCIESLRTKIAALMKERDEISDYANRIADSKHAQLAALTKERDAANAAAEEMEAALIEAGKEFQRQITALTTELDELAGANALNRNALKISHAKLAAAQAQIVQLRETLNEVRISARLGVTTISSELLSLIEAGINLPSDDTALQERLAQERKLCEEACEAVEVHDVGHPGTAFTVQGLCISAIRSMK